MRTATRSSWRGTKPLTMAGGRTVSVQKFKSCPFILWSVYFLPDSFHDEDGEGLPGVWEEEETLVSRGADR